MSLKCTGLTPYGYKLYGEKERFVFLSNAKVNVTCSGTPIYMF